MGSFSGTFTVDNPCSNDPSVVGGLQFKRKTANESVTSSTTLQRDDHLHGFTLDANSRYEVELVLNYDGANNGDLALNFDDDGGGSVLNTANGFVVALHSGATTLNETRAIPTTSLTVIGTVLGNTLAAHYKGQLLTPGSPATMALWWAQGTSNGTATRILAESYMKLTKLS